MSRRSNQTYAQTRECSALLQIGRLRRQNDPGSCSPSASAICNPSPRDPPVTSASSGKVKSFLYATHVFLGNDKCGREHHLDADV